MSDEAIVFETTESVGQVFDKLPTLRQWIKAQGKKAIAKRFLVSLVWEPNQWSNYTLETERFKVRVSKGDPVFEALSKNLPRLLDEEQAFFVEIVNREKGAFKLVANPNEPGHWEHITDTGHKWVVPS